MARDIYIANKYATNPPSNYANVRIPLLQSSSPNRPNYVANTNLEKVKELSSTFFPPPPVSISIPATAYPEPLKNYSYFSHEDIRKTIHRLKPHKALGLDRIQNVVLQKCVNTIIDHLYYLFHAILELGVYPSRWLVLLTIVLCKPGKATYNVTKAYHLIGLIETIGKLFSTLVATDLSFITEKYNLLPPTQFGGRPGCCTTDTMHLVVTKVKNTWRAGKVTSALFLDIQVVFPNTVKELLLHNMKSCQVPA